MFFCRPFNNCFLNHLRVSEASWRGTAFISKCCRPLAIPGRKYATSWKLLQAEKTTDSMNTSTLLLYQASGLLLPVCSTLTSQGSKMSFPRARRTGYGRAPRDIQVFSALASSQKSSHSQRGKMHCTQCRQDGGTCLPRQGARSMLRRARSTNTQHFSTSLLAASSVYISGLIFTV